MKKLIFVILMCAAIPLGCTEEEFKQADRIATTTIDTTEAGETVLNSPAGQAIPADIKFWITLGGAIAASAAAGYLDWRKNQMEKLNTAMVRGIDKAEKTEANPISVKSAIAEERKRLSIYDRSEKIIQKAKLA